MSIVKNKWNKENFIKTVKTNCFGHTSNVIVDLVNFSESTADNLSWGKGENCGTMTYKCKCEDYGLIPLFNLKTEVDRFQADISGISARLKQ